MIKYSLYCDKGHDFDSWFASSEGFDTQVKRGQVECPFCGSLKISKALMAPSVSTSRKKEAGRQALQQAHVHQAIARAQANEGHGADNVPTDKPAKQAPASPGSAATTPASGSGPVALLDEDQRKLRAAIKELHDKVTENTVDVGNNFAAEARKIHDGDAPERAIRGQASMKQAKELWEDGIAVLPLPALPDDKN